MKKKVLIVDDEPNILMSLEFLMKKNDFNVFIARDGSEALTIVQQENPEVIILDIMMPNVDGYEVCQFIKKEPSLKSKVIFLSAKSKQSDIDKGYEAGADYYMTKPFSTKNIVSKVNELSILT
ncbi:MAG: response regulator [Bacteroidota bacterium]